MLGKSLSIVDITKYQDRKTMGQIARELGISKSAISIRCRHAQHGKLETALEQKKASGQPRKTPKMIDQLLKRTVMKYFSIISKELIHKKPGVLGNV